MVGMNPSPAFAFLLLAVMLIGIGVASVFWGFFAVAFTVGPFIAIAMLVRYFIRLGSQPSVSR